MKRLLIMFSLLTIVFSASAENFTLDVEVKEFIYPHEKVGKYKDIKGKLGVLEFDKIKMRKGELRTRQRTEQIKELTFEVEEDVVWISMPGFLDVGHEGTSIVKFFNNIKLATVKEMTLKIDNSILNFSGLHADFAYETSIAPNADPSSNFIAGTLDNISLFCKATAGILDDKKEFITGCINNLKIEKYGDQQEEGAIKLVLNDNSSSFKISECKITKNKITFIGSDLYAEFSPSPATVFRITSKEINFEAKKNIWTEKTLAHKALETLLSEMTFKVPSLKIELGEDISILLNSNIIKSNGKTIQYIGPSFQAKYFDSNITFKTVKLQCALPVEITKDINANHFIQGCFKDSALSVSSLILENEMVKVDYGATYITKNEKAFSIRTPEIVIETKGNDEKSSITIEGININCKAGTPPGDDFVAENAITEIAEGCFDSSDISIKNIKIQHPRIKQANIKIKEINLNPIDGMHNFKFYVPKAEFTVGDGKTTIEELNFTCSLKDSYAIVSTWDWHTILENCINNTKISIGKLESVKPKGTWKERAKKGFGIGTGFGMWDIKSMEGMEFDSQFLGDNKFKLSIKNIILGGFDVDYSLYGVIDYNTKTQEIKIYVADSQWNIFENSAEENLEEDERFKAFVNSSSEESKKMARANFTVSKHSTGGFLKAGKHEDFSVDMVTKYILESISEDNEYVSVATVKNTATNVTQQEITIHLPIPEDSEYQEERYANQDELFMPPGD